MFLRHTKKHGDCWVSDFWHEGKRYTKSWGAITKTVATEKDRKFRTEVLEGKHALRSKRITFENFSEKYLEYARLNKKPKSVERNETSITMLTPHFQGKLLGSIHPFMAEQYKKARRAEGKAPATINRDIACLRNMMNKAIEWRYLTENPLKGVKQMREDNERRWVLTGDEEKKLLEACEKSPQRKKAKYLKELVLFALHSGMRLEEIFNLRKANVFLDQRNILVTDTKNNENRKVPINDTLKEILERRLRDEKSDYVFWNSKGEKLTVLTNAFWTAVKDSGLTRFESVRGEMKKVRFRFHDLRHTFGTRLGIGGIDLKTIMEIMGHRTIRVAMSYQHPAPDHKLNAVRILDQLPSNSTTEKIVDLKTSSVLSR